MKQKKGIYLTQIVFWVAGYVVEAFANPEGGIVSSGSAEISNLDNATIIHQHSQRAIIDWKEFDIQAGEVTSFIQPNRDSTILNRINSEDPSTIAGTLEANGNIVLINKNGILFDSGSSIDVGSLLASTADIINEDFMDGCEKFDIPGNGDAIISNLGRINAAKGGTVSLIGPVVHNNGIINARKGIVSLSTGETATINLGGVEVAVTQEQYQKAVLTGPDSKITADGGSIIITAAAGKEIVNSLISLDGEIIARSVGEENGQIFIYGEGSNAVAENDDSQKGKKSGNSEVIVEALLDVSGKGDGERGGEVHVLGDMIGIGNSAVIDAVGKSGEVGKLDKQNPSAERPGSAGGSVKIGGDYLGKGDTPAAKAVFVKQDAKIHVDSLDMGDGGRVILWSDGTTTFEGKITGKGAPNGGDGGFVETSGKEELHATGTVDLTSEKGKSGTYLLDPNAILIYGNMTGPGFVGNIGLHSRDTYQDANGNTVYIAMDDFAHGLNIWLDGSNASGISLLFQNDDIAASTATGNIGSNTITTSTDISGYLKPGMVIGLDVPLGTTSTANSLPNSTYEVDSVSGGTVTLKSNLTRTYSGAQISRALISSWSSKQGTALAVQSNTSMMPKWLKSSNSANGNGGAYFDGVDDFMHLASDSDPANLGKNVIPYGNSRYYMLSVVQSDLENTNAGIIGSGQMDGTANASNTLNFFNNGGFAQFLNDYGVNMYWSTIGSISHTQMNMVDASLSSSGAVRMFVNVDTTENQGPFGNPNMSNRNSTNINNKIGVTDHGYLNGSIYDVAVYSRDIAANQTLTNIYDAGYSVPLLRQFFARKYNTPLLGYSQSQYGNELNYSVNNGQTTYFTTKYLEYLSNMADISIASVWLALDLQGDTLNIAPGRSFTANVNAIANQVSPGTIQTNGGDVSITLVTDGLFDVEHPLTFKTNGGNFSFLNTQPNNGDTPRAFGANFSVDTGGGDISLVSPYINLTSSNISLNSGGGNTTLQGRIEMDGTSGLTISNAGTASIAGDIVKISGNASIDIQAGSVTSLPNITADTVSVRTTNAGGDIVIPSGTTISASGSGTPLILAAKGNLINNSSASALSAPSGRWLLYSTNPATDVLGGLSPSFRRFSCLYGGTCPAFPATLNGILYSYTPMLDIIPDSYNLIYGDAGPANYTFNVSGYLGSDQSNDVLSGSLGSGYAQGDDAGAYPISHVGSGFGSTLGYGFSYHVANVNVGKRTTNLEVSALNKTFDGLRDAKFNLSGASFTNLYGSDRMTLESATGKFSDPMAGYGKTVYPTDFVFGGPKSKNYDVVYRSTYTADINPRGLTVYGMNVFASGVPSNTRLFSYQGSVAGYAPDFSGDVEVVQVNRGEWHILPGTLLTSGNYKLEKFVPGVILNVPGSVIESNNLEEKQPENIVQKRSNNSSWYHENVIGSKAYSILPILSIAEDLHNDVDVTFSNSIIR